MQNTSESNTEKRKEVTALLQRLSSSDAGPAWVDFLDLYAPLIMKAARRFEYRQDRVDECFLYVCEQLNDSGFKRLLTFNTRGKASFQTWLGAVVFNLCVDWHRTTFGRATMLPAISALPSFDRMVYRLVIEQQMKKEAAFQTLRADFPDLEREAICKSLGRIHSLLTPQQRWNIHVRRMRKLPASGDAEHDRVEKLPSAESGPDARLQKQQELEALEIALSNLPPAQRLILRLRFQEGLSLQKIADLTGLEDTNRAWRKVQAAIKALVKQSRRRNSILERKN